MHGSNGSRSSEHSNVASATLVSKSIVACELWTSPPVAGSPSVPGVKPGPAVKLVADAEQPPRVDRRLADVALEVDRAHEEGVRADLGLLEPPLEAALVHVGHGLEAAVLPRVEVDLALEGDVRLVGVEREQRVQGPGLGLGLHVDERLRRDARGQRPVLPGVARRRVVGQLAEVDRADLERVHARAEVGDLVRVLAVLPRLVVGGVEPALEDEVDQRRRVVAARVGEARVAAVADQRRRVDDRRLRRARGRAAHADDADALGRLGVAGGEVAAAVDRPDRGVDAVAAVEHRVVGREGVAAALDDDAVAAVGVRACCARSGCPGRPGRSRRSRCPRRRCRWPGCRRCRCRTSSSSEMPVPSVPPALLSSIRLWLDSLSSTPSLLERRSLPRTTRAAGELERDAGAVGVADVVVEHLRPERVGDAHAGAVAVPRSCCARRRCCWTGSAPRRPRRPSPLVTITLSAIVLLAAALHEHAGAGGADDLVARDHRLARLLEVHGVVGLVPNALSRTTAWRVPLKRPTPYLLAEIVFAADRVARARSGRRRTGRCRPPGCSRPAAPVTTFCDVPGLSCTP